MTCTSLRAPYGSSNCAHVVLLSVSEFSWTSQNLIHYINKRVKEKEEGLLHVETTFFFFSAKSDSEKYDVQNVEAVRMLTKSCFQWNAQLLL